MSKRLLQETFQPTMTFSDCQKAEGRQAPFALQAGKEQLPKLLQQVLSRQKTLFEKSDHTLQVYFKRIMQLKIVDTFDLHYDIVNVKSRLL